MKKRMIFMLLALLYVYISKAQVAVNTTGNAADASAMLDVQSTEKGILIPRMTQSERDAISSPATGLTVFQTDGMSGYYFYNGTEWISVSHDDDWIINSDTTIYASNDRMVGIGITQPNALLHLKKSPPDPIFSDGFEDNTIDPFTSADWTTENTTVNSGSYAAQSGNQGQDDSVSTIALENIDIPDQGAIITFAFKVSSEQNYDFLRFYIDGNLIEEWSGDVGWSNYSETVESGTHTFEWKYEKDGSVDAGDDTGYLDDVVITPLSNIFRLEDGNEGSNYILVSNANGFATWKDPVANGFSNWTKDGDNIYNNNSGNVGVGTQSPSYLFHVESDQSGNPVLYAENLNSSDDYSHGMTGVTNDASSGNSAGVYGFNAGWSKGIGVWGEYYLWGVSVAGIAWGTSTADIPTVNSGDDYMDIGVFGSADYDPSVGVYGYCPNDTTGYAGYFDGRLTTTGAKNASIPTSQGNQLVYSMESPEVWFEDFGREQLINGQAHIRLDPLFIEATFIDEKHPMHVFVQEEGESNGLYVIPDEDGKGFTVKEKNNGQSGIKFSYRIVAKRRFYQDHRFGVDPVQPLGNNLAKAHYVNPPTRSVNEMKAILQKALSKKKHPGKPSFMQAQATQDSNKKKR